VNGGITWIVGGGLTVAAVVLWSLGSPEAITAIYAALGLIVVAAVGRSMSTSADKQWLPVAISFAYLVKLAASATRYSVLAFIYDFSGDATRYHSAGNRLVEVWRALEIPEISIGTRFVEVATAFLYIPYVPTMLGGFFIFATLAFFGQLLLYAAFRLSAEPRRLRWYAAVILFLPTIVYWPSSIGKESLMFLFIGAAAYGAAALLRDHRLRWATLFGIGAAGAAVIRPHIALLLVVALATALLFGKGRTGRGLSWRKILAIATIGGVLVAVTAVTATKFGIDFASGPTATEGFDNVLNEVERQTNQGGSGLTGVSIKSPQEFPAGFVKVLFRPFPQEANNVQALASSVEGMLLLGLLLWRLIPSIRNGWHIRKDPYLIFALVFTTGFIVAFSAFNNFGLLARQRSQVMPFFIALLIALGWSTLEDRAVAEDDAVENIPQRTFS